MGRWGRDGGRIVVRRAYRLHLEHGTTAMLYLPTGLPTVRVVLNEDTYNAMGKPRSMVVELDVMSAGADGD